MEPANKIGATLFEQQLQDAIRIEKVRKVGVLTLIVLLIITGFTLISTGRLVSTVDCRGYLAVRACSLLRRCGRCRRPVDL